MFTAAAFALFCVVCSILAFQRHPIYGLYFYMATTYVHPPSRWWAYMLPDVRWALVSALITVLAVVAHRGRLSERPNFAANGLIVVLITYVSWMWIQTFWALDQPLHIFGTVLITKYIVAMWFIYRITDTVDNLRNFLFTHSIGCSILGVMARFTEREAGRVEGVGGPGIDDANSLGMFLATGAVVTMGLVLTQKGWRRWLALLLLPLILEGFVVANSRGSFLGLAAGLMVLTVTKAKAYRRVFWGAALAALVFGYIAVDKMFVERMFTIGDVTAQSEEADMSARSRAAIIAAQLEMARDWPLGAGHRGTAPLSPQYLDRKWLVNNGEDPNAQRSSHNTFLSALVEQGVLGAALFIGIVIWMLGAIIRIRRMDRMGSPPELVTLAATATSAVFVTLVAGVATDYLVSEVWYWMMIGVVSALKIDSTMRARAAPPLPVPVPPAAALAKTPHRA